MVCAKLVGFAVFCTAWVGAAERLHSAVIETSIIPDLSGLAAGPDTGLIDKVAAGGSFITQLLAVAAPGSADDELGRPAGSFKDRDEPADPATLPSPDLPLGVAAGPFITASEFSAAVNDFDLTVRRPSFDGLQTLSSGTSLAVLDELVAPPDSRDPGPFWAGMADIVVGYMVPALAVLAFVVSGLLLRELMRRRRRATLARQIKRRFGGSARRRRHAESMPSD